MSRGVNRVPDSERGLRIASDVIGIIAAFHGRTDHLAEVDLYAPWQVQGICHSDPGQTI